MSVSIFPASANAGPPTVVARTAAKDPLPSWEQSLVSLTKTSILSTLILTVVERPGTMRVGKAEFLPAYDYFECVRLNLREVAVFIL